MTHTKVREISSLGENEQLPPCGDTNFLERISWQHSNLSVHQWLISSKKISLSLVMPNAGSIVWHDLLKAWHSVSRSRSVCFSIVWVWSSFTQTDTVPVVVIYKVIWSPFCVIGKDSLQLHWQKTFFSGLAKFFGGRNNVSFRMHLQHYLILRPVKRELTQVWKSSEL